MIIYFHGLGSNGNTLKVKTLRDAGFNVVAPDIPIDPILAETYLIGFIRGAIGAAVELGDEKVAFVGTSLGGYWAARMGGMFDAKQVLVNPSFTPAKTLTNYIETGYVDYATGETVKMKAEDVAEYDPIDPAETANMRTYYIATRDPVVAPVTPDNRSVAHYYDTDDHRGDEFFADVIGHLRACGV